MAQNGKRTGVTSEHLATATEYTGWAAWVRNRSEPLLEARVPDPARYQTLPGAREHEVRRPGGTVIDWNDLPHARVDRLELYYARDAFRHGGPYGCGQPVVRLDRPPELQWRLIQMKMRAVQVEARAGPGDEGGGPMRTGIQGYLVGYYNVAGGFAELLRVLPDGKPPRRKTLAGHPCWPQPVGWGLNPAVLGINPSEVPDPPRPGGEQQAAGELIGGS